MPSRVRSLALVLTLAGVALAASGCAASVKRTGYEAPPPRLDVAEASAPEAGLCPVLITADTTAVDAASEVLGEIRYSDSGFSTRCDEARALRLFRDDACHLGADVVLLTDERSPNLWSTCYRATARFYRVGDPDRLAAVLDRRTPSRLVVNRGDQSGDQAVVLVVTLLTLSTVSLVLALLTGGE